MSRRRRLWTLLAPILPSPSRGQVSRTLLTSALSGLLAVGCGGGGAKGEPDPTADASVDVSVDTSGSQPDGGTSGDAATDGWVIITETEGNRTFANVIAECDTRNGYTQVHAACAGANSCAGFSYGDWDPGVTSEHTCAGANGCNGISCVVLPKDSGKSGKEVYEEKLPETGPRSCTNCHGGYDEVTKATDPAKFKVYFMPGEQTRPEGRTLQNWLTKRTPLEQARIVAFGAVGRLPDGTAFSNMAAYHKLYSRAEIERAVEYIRTKLEPLEVNIKTQD